MPHSRLASSAILQYGMRRSPRDPHDDPPRERGRTAPGPVPTIGELLRERNGRWVWVYCRNSECGHYRAMPLAPFAIRWGMHASSDLVRKLLRCSACGEKGVSISRSLDAFSASGAAQRHDETANPMMRARRKFQRA
jgi:hypothetical protein